MYLFILIEGDSCFRFPTNERKLVCLKKREQTIETVCFVRKSWNFQFTAFYKWALFSYEVSENDSLFLMTKEQAISHLTSDYRLYRLVTIDYID